MIYSFFTRFVLSSFMLCVFLGVAYAEEVLPDINNSVEAAQQQVITETRDKPAAEIPAQTTGEDPAATIQKLQLRVEALEALMQDRQAKLLPEEENKTNQSANDVKTAERVEQERNENLSLIESAFKRTLVEEGGLLLQPGQFNYVPTLTYTHSSSDRIVVDGFTIQEILVVGDIVSRQVRRDLAVFTNAFRLGLRNDMQIDMQIPVGRERLHTYSSAGDETDERTSSLGDISLSLSYQLIKSSVAWPDTLINLSWKSTSGDDPFGLASNEELALGSGFQSWGLSFTSVSVSDPVVFFSGLSWTDNIGDTKNIGDVDPGDSLGLHLGMVFALNLNTSMSYGFQLSAIEKTTINGQNIPGSNLLTSLFTVGVSRILTNQISMDIQIGIGLTSDSPDVQLSLSFPYSSL
jgi:hypothetical protein